MTLTPDSAASATAAPAECEGRPRIIHSHFATSGQASPLLAWRARIAHVMDLAPTRAQLALPFAGAIDCYAVGDVVFTDCRTGALEMERSVARISTGPERGFAFQVTVEGDPGTVAGWQARAPTPVAVGSIVLLDMDQPLRIRRGACRVLSVFAPRALVDAAIPEADALHGRVLDNANPMTGLLVDHLQALAREVAGASPPQALESIQLSIDLMALAFGKQAGLSGNSRATLRAAAFGTVRRRIDAKLDQPGLCGEQLTGDLQLSRSVLYRMFEHEGGLVAYIRQRRLRAAADELVRFPALAVKDIAYGLGFQSASDFTRAFRRAFGMAPQDLRAQVQQAAPA